MLRIAWPSEGSGASTSIAAAQVGQGARLRPHRLVADGDPDQPHALVFQNVERRHGPLVPSLGQTELAVGPLSARMQRCRERGTDHLLGLEPSEGRTAAPELVDAFDG